VWTFWIDSKNFNFLLKIYMNFHFHFCVIFEWKILNEFLGFNFILHIFTKCIIISWRHDPKNTVVLAISKLIRNFFKCMNQLNWYEKLKLYIKYIYEFSFPFLRDIWMKSIEYYEINSSEFRTLRTTVGCVMLDGTTQISLTHSHGNRAGEFPRHSEKRLPQPATRKTIHLGWQF